VIQERKRFGPLGWNRPYDFNDSDMEISKKQMAQFLDEYEVVPYRVIHFCTNYLHYGGRVTDDKDLRTIDVILRDYYQPAIVDDPAYKFSPSGVYYAPSLSEATCPGGSLLKGCLEFIEGLPLNADPEVFGMHANANITCEVTETELSLEILLALQPKDAGSGGSGGGKGGKGGKAGAPAVKSRDDIIGETAAAVLAKLPPPFDVEAIQMAYPVVYHESMNTVLAQECIRYNKLINVIASTLRDVGKALKGLTVMSKELDEVGTALAANKVPPQWEAKSYPTLKPMASYVADLMDRLAFIGGWVERGTPAVFWVSGFFFPQAFFTGTMQNYARSKALPIDTLQFNFNYMCNAPWEGIAAKPEAGCYIRGLFLEGARFDEDKGMLEESIPKQLFSSMPVIHLVPVQFRKTTPGGIYRACRGRGAHLFLLRPPPVSRLRSPHARTHTRSHYRHTPPSLRRLPRVQDPVALGRAGHFGPLEQLCHVPGDPHGQGRH
jgi:dynein heavy chain